MLIGSLPTLKSLSTSLHQTSNISIYHLRLTIHKLFISTRLNVATPLTKSPTSNRRDVRYICVTRHFWKKWFRMMFVKLNLMIGVPWWLSLNVRSAFLQRSCQCNVSIGESLEIRRTVETVSGTSEEKSPVLYWPGSADLRVDEDSLQRLRHEIENFCH